MIEVRKTDKYKSMLFNDEFIQGRVNASGQISLLYMKEIMKVFNHVENIKHVCLLGLGAGNLHTEIYNKFPDVHIDTVEINPEVIEIAHKEFNLPKSKRLRIIQGDVHDYIHEVHNYDVVIVDVYDADGQVMLDNRWLRQQGKCIVYNSLVNKDTYQSYMTELNTLYDRVHEQYKPKLSSEEYNHIAFCFND